MRKITMIINSLGGGGAERICLTLCYGFVTRGYDIELVLLTETNAVFLQSLPASVTVTHLHTPRARYAFIKLARYLKEKKPETVLIFNYHVALLLILAKIIFGLKTRLVPRTISTLSQRHKNYPFFHRHFFRLLTRCFYKKSDQIIAQSQGMKNDLIRHYDVPADKITVIHNPVSPDIESYFAAPHKVDKGNYILCVGRLEKVKAYGYAVEAFAKLQKNDPGLRLKFIGEGSQKSSLKNLCAELGVQNHVDFVGFQRDVISFYLGASTTLLTSLYEGFPNVLVESISLGTPIVAFDCQSGPAEIIQDGINGYLARYQDGPHLVSCLEKAIKTAWDREAVRATAVKYSSAAIIQRYLDILDSRHA